MDQCPSELWTRIFGLACTDGGLTGCSVALVSHYFREAVLPVQLSSVSLCGTKKMSAFADLLEQREPAHRRVRHLLLSSASGSHRTTPPNNVNDADGADGADEADNVDVVLLRILAAVAPDLLTLTSTLPHRTITEHNTLTATFPLLTELTMYGGLFYPAPSTERAHDYFPSLRYLSIPPSYNVLHLYTLRAPKLTHLRLPNWFSMSTELKEALKRFLDGSVDTDEDPGAGECPFPSTLQKITIHDDMEPPGSGDSYVSAVFVGLMLSDTDSKLETPGWWGRRYYGPNSKSNP